MSRAGEFELRAASISHAELGRPAGLEITVSRESPKREKLRIAVVAQIQHPWETRRGVTIFVPEAVLRLGSDQKPGPARESQKREKLRIAVVAQIQHPWETRRGVTIFVPEAVLRLGSDQKPDPARDARTLDFARRHQSQQRPRGLRGRARGGFVSLIIQFVARPLLAPTPVRILDGGEPTGRLSHFWGLAIEPCDTQAAERRPSPIDVVHAPSAVPASVRALRSTEKGEAVA